MVEPRAITEARERRLGTSNLTRQQRIQELNRVRARQRAEASRREFERQKAEAKAMAQARIEQYRKDIDFIKQQLDRAARGELKGKKYRGDRARKIWNNRITGQQEAINFLQANLDKGYDPNELIKAADDIRLAKTRQLERKRKSQFTAGSSKSTFITSATRGVKIEKGQVSPQFKRVPTKEQRILGNKIRIIAESMRIKSENEKIKKAFEESGLDFLNKAYTPKQRKEIYDRLTKPELLSRPNQNISPRVAELFQVTEKTREKPVIRDIKSQLSKLNLPTTTQERIVSGQSLTSADRDKLRSFVSLDRQIQSGKTLTPAEIKNVRSTINKSKAEVRAKFLVGLDRAPIDVVEALGEVAYDLTIGAAIGVFNASKLWGETLGTALRERRFNDFLIGVGSGPIGYIATRPKTKEIAKFVIKNPVEAAEIFGLALAAGMAGAQKSFSDNPVKATVKAIAYLSPKKVYGAILKPVKATIRGLDKLAFAKPELITQISKEVSAARKIAKLKSFKDLSKTKQKAFLRDLKVLETELNNLKEANRISNQFKSLLGGKLKIDNIIDVTKVTPKTIKTIRKIPVNKVIAIDKKADKLNKALRGVKATNKRINKKIANLSKIQKELQAAPKVSKVKAPKVKKLTKAQRTIVSNYTKELNSLTRKINGLKTRLDKPGVSGLKKAALEAELNFYNNLRQTANAKFGTKLLEDKLNIKQLKAFTTELKKAQTVKKISDKLIKLETKIKNAGYSDFNLLPPNQAKKVRKLLVKVRDIRNLSTAQINALNKSIDNILKISFKKAPKVKKFPRALFNKEIIKGEKLSKLTKSDINNILSRKNGRATLKTRLDNINKQANKLENQIKQAKAAGKFLSKTEKQALGKQIAKATQELKNLKATSTRLSNELKGLRKGVSQAQAARRAETFTEARKNAKNITIQKGAKVSDNTITKTFKFGKHELEVELVNFKIGKGGSIGAQRSKGIPRVKVRYKRTGVARDIKPYDRAAKTIERGINNNPRYKKNIRFSNKLDKFSRRVEKASNRKLSTDQKRTLAQARKNIKDIIKLLEKSNDFVALRVAAQVIGIARALDRVQIKDIEALYSPINKKLEELNRYTKQLEKIKVPQPKKPRKPQGKVIKRPTGKKISVPRKPQPKPIPRIPRPVNGGGPGPGKKPLPPIRFALPKLPRRGSRNAYQAVFYSKGKPVARTQQLLPLNRVHNLSRRRILNRSNFDAYRITEIGKTDIVDVNQRLFNDRFNKNKSIYKQNAKKINKVKSKTIKKTKKSSQIALKNKKKLKRKKSTSTRRNKK